MVDSTIPKHAAVWAVLLAATSLACGDGSPVSLGPPDGIPPLTPPPWVPAPDHAGPPPSCDAFPQDFSIWFADANLEAAVRAAVGVGAEEPLTCGLVSGLTTLVAREAGILDLEGIQNLRALTSLGLRDNPELRDIGPLGELTNLVLLDLDWNPLIDDVGPLSGLTSLERLSIGGIGGVPGENALADLGPLTGLTNLTFLNLRASSVQDVAPLSGLVNLAFLNLAYNYVSDVSPLGSLEGLTYLAVNANGLADISGLGGLTSLTSLWIGDNPISDFDPLSGLVNIRSLWAYRTPVSDIGALQFLTSLSSLSLFANASLSDIQPLLANAGLGPGDRVSLSSTNVSCVDVAALEAKGVTVSSDCP